ncbi:sigma factor-like helix-turn-helix DNA-binding protein [Nocardia ignorata]|uniref:Sigma-70-like protein n=1 Tax=Nocardia ignorata TaxID=145285 RepID=A0A4R6P069_NOCIG|nr:sigma-70 region 4 domain-containing protein [Nocardia ignorata]TDP29775.1 sigma-70-like protein [Nocardia ignorata]
MARKKTTPVETLVETQQKRNRALELRIEGKSQAEIAQELGVSSSSVSRYITQAVKDITRENAEEYLQLELNRLDAMLAAIWPKIIHAEEGQTWFIDRALAIMDQRAKLTGSYKAAELKAIAEAKGGVSAEATSMVGNFMGRLEELVAADALAARTEDEDEDGGIE